jgi:hypothetical protein
MKTLGELFEEYEEFRARWRGRAIEHGSDEDARYEYERKKIEELILGHPDSFDRVRCWMVDVHGYRVCTHDSDAENERDMRQMLDDLQEKGPAALDSVGDLARSVRVSMDGMAPITDASAGCESWHLGAHCTFAEARKICEKLYKVYAMEIDKGILRVERILWSLRLVEGAVQA